MAPAADGFDGKRRGFLLGGGVGLGANLHENALMREASAGYNKTATTTAVSPGLATDVKIGGSTNEYLLLYYHAWSTFMRAEETVGDERAVLSQIAGVGTRLYPDLASEWYFMGTVGLSYWGAPTKFDGDSMVGIGFVAGVGREFRRHWSYEITLGWGLPSFTSGADRVQSNSVAMQVMITGLAY